MYAVIKLGSKVYARGPFDHIELEAENLQGFVESGDTVVLVNELEDAVLLDLDLDDVDEIEVVEVE
jgi:hypothetical protein